MIKKILTNLGISPNAASVYLEILQNGATSVDRLSTATGIKRTSIYPYINELKSLGLIVWDERETGKAIKTTDPNALLLLADRKNRETTEAKETVKRALPDILAMQQLVDNTYTVFKYVGANQCKKAIEQVYAEDELFGYCGEFVYDDLGKGWYEKHLERMYKKNHIQDHVIFPVRAAANIPYKHLLQTIWFDSTYAHYKIHPTLNLPPSLDVYILKHRVLTLLSDTEPMCIVVNSQKFRDYEKSLFDALWTGATDIAKWRLS